LECIRCGTISTTSQEEIIFYQQQFSVQTNAASIVNQQKNLERFFSIHNKDADQKGIKQLSSAVVSTAIDLFMEYRGKKSETRNKKRVRYIGACIYFACQMHNQIRDKKEIQQFLDIPDRNISTAITDMEIEFNQGKINMAKPLLDSRFSITDKLCHLLKVDAKNIEQIRADMLYVTEIIFKNMLTTNNSEIINKAAIFISLRVNGVQVSKNDFCKLCNTKRKDTMTKIINVVTENMYLFKRFNDRFR